ncbi:MmcQ/YjbR family DNA-binding protein [Sphingomonas melonis]|uniref:MmcQ/YjbR family DNA-binding protein n=1 Tax=Sphingomonas melonis TaxID=152682 RepID=A0A7Y9FLR4_9SPHN|nr:MmcQ/YjbR family DNA-binding protein [Sphingomonas melonis]NYD89651.1 hypothetical protein [Sphingomonas melonis]
MIDVSPVLARVRAVALLLPEAEERTQDGHSFVVGDAAFVRVRDGADGTVVVQLLDDDSRWADITVTDDTDWTLVEDRIAHSWELAAPRDLLEAGGR